MAKNSRRSTTVMTIDYKGEALQLQEGDVIIYRTEFKWSSPMSYLAAAVRLFTGVPYNHATMVLEVEDTPMKFESNEKGIRATFLQRFIERPHSKIIILRNKSLKRTPKEMRELALSLLGRPYDVLTLAWWQLIYRMFKVWTGQVNEEKVTEKMACTDFVAYIHGLDDYYLYSAKEFMENPDFEVVYQEK